MSKPSQPNILMIVSDQHRADCVAVDPHAPECLATPNLDHIAARGAFFGRAYSECPTCVPARRSLFSGLAPAAHGMVGMIDMDFEVPAKLPVLLRDAGYQTELVGKTHLFPGGKRHGFEHAVFADASRGDWGSCRYTEFLMRHGHFEPRAGVAHGVFSNSWSGRPSHLPEHLTHSYWCVDQALDFLEHRDRSCPFFLNVGFIDPHPPYTPPQWCYDRYINADLPAPVAGEWAAADRPDRTARTIEGPCVDLAPDEWRRTRAAYYGLINHMDNQIGRLLMYLRDRKLIENTLVLYTSDHGEMLGDHFRNGKARPFDASARVPLLIAPPKGWNMSPVRSDAPVGLQDVMPTLLDAVGLDVPDHCTGRSLMPLVRGEGAAPREFIHGEHTDQYRTGEGMHYLTDGRWKYVWYAGNGRELLFDLADDPGECVDLSATADVRPWRARLIDVLADRPEGFVDGSRLVPGRPYERVMPGYENGTAQAFV